MSALLGVPLLWGQAFLRGVPDSVRNLITWLYLFGEPLITTPGFLGALLTWVKVLSLFCLLGWVLSWLSTAIKERVVANNGWLDVAFLVSILGVIGTVGMAVLEKTERIPIYKFLGVYVVWILAAVWTTLIFIWVERALWGAIRRKGGWLDLAVLVGVHLALIIGIGVGFLIRDAVNRLQATEVVTQQTWVDGLTNGLRLAGTYMGYVILLRVTFAILFELISVRLRRLYSIAWLSVVESNRRMWAPWVVITMFLVILAFTHWFLTPPRPAEMGRLYVNSLLLLITALLTLMVTFLTPLSLPQDIQAQTVYTVVSKPVRRIEMIWGRMIGYMVLVTFIVLIYGGISLLYLKRTVGGKITQTYEQAVQAAAKDKPFEARQLREQAEQLGTRMAARVPLYGSLTFLDSKGTPRVRGIDVGQEQSMREPRSHIEGATPSTAIWRYGIVPDPMRPVGQRPIMLDHRLPTELLLKRDSIEGLLDRRYILETQISAAEQQQAEGRLSADAAKRLSATVARSREELQKVKDEYEKRKAQASDLNAKAAEAEKAGRDAEAQALNAQAAALHSPPIKVEMTFNVYRTTKGKIGEPVYAQITVKNTLTGAEYYNNFPIREYYTNKEPIPSELIAGLTATPAAMLQIEIRCLSPTQYLGMAESDLYLLADSGNFGTNFMKGLFGVWLQAMVLTAIGVFAGSFLSWPVALLTTLAFFFAGWVAFTFLLEFTRQSILGGGPFESLIRLVTHDNQTTELTPTVAVVIAKTLDSLVMPIMSRLVYVVPNFAALDVSNTVADGFAVTLPQMLSGFLLALAYAMPFSIAGFFILKNREVAA